MGNGVTPEKAFGEVLKELRNERKFSQEELAFQAGLERNYISLLELGKNSASIKMLFKLAPKLNVTVSEMMAMVETRMREADKKPKRA